MSASEPCNPMITVFSTEWFLQQQRWLLRAANLPVLGNELRAALGISLRGRLTRILPNATIADRGDNIYQAEFRSHDKHGKGLYRQGYYLWRLMHEWDRFVANPWVPALNLGFDTLTTYPDSGNPGTTTCDARVSTYSKNEAWAALIAEAGDGIDGNATDYPARIQAQTGSNLWLGLFRGIFMFDTSSLGSGATITAATFSLFGFDKFDQFSPLIAPNIDVYAASPASTNSLTQTDFRPLVPHRSRARQFPMPVGRHRLTTISP
jgi:hypothetical protein